jgi:hypothetical protein
MHHSSSRICPRGLRCWTPSRKEVLEYTKIHLLLVNLLWLFCWKWAVNSSSRICPRGLRCGRCHSVIHEPIIFSLRTLFYSGNHLGNRKFPRTSLYTFFSTVVVKWCCNLISNVSSSGKWTFKCRALIVCPFSKTTLHTLLWKKSFSAKEP